MGEMIEGTPEFQRYFDMHQPSDPEMVEIANQVTARYIMQQIIAENINDPDLDWIVFQTAAEIEEENGLPYGVTADDVYQEFLHYFEGE
jgi:hypothetical protein